MWLFHNSTFFGSCIIHILHIGVLKFKNKFGRLRVKTAHQGRFRDPSTDQYQYTQLQTAKQKGTVSSRYCGPRGQFGAKDNAEGLQFGRTADA
jgi:hypothetical protein